jgi:hypothetical protein
MSGSNKEGTYQEGMEGKMRRDMSWGKKIAILIATTCLILAMPLSAQTKKLQVITERANLYLDADERSPIVETLLKGATMTLASAIKTRMNWFYVYYISLQTGKTRSGYILDSLVRKLYADVKVINISSEDEITQPGDLDFNDGYRPILDWGAAKDKIINLEGRPSGQEKANGLEVIRYKRSIMAKNCLVEYIFDNNCLVTARYNLLEKYADKNRYIEEYLKIKDNLVSKIGAPRADTVTWQDPTYKSNNAFWGRALSMGHLEYHTTWELSETELQITLAGSANQVSFGAEFKGLKFKSASL